MTHKPKRKPLLPHSPTNEGESAIPEETEVADRVREVEEEEKNPADQAGVLDEEVAEAIDEAGPFLPANVEVDSMTKAEASGFALRHFGVWLDDSQRVAQMRTSLRNLLSSGGRARYRR
jgi:hypothetical protein